MSGRSISLSLPRRLVGDLLHFAHKIPSVPVQRQMDVSRVRSLRAALQNPVSWTAIFTKAFARAALDCPELRRAYMPWPWPHLYESDESVASVAVERDYKGEKAVFFAHLRTPEHQTLRKLDGYLREFREEPVESFGLFRRALFTSRLPWPLRWLIWSIGLYSSGKKRARRMGTFGVSVYSGLGAESLHPLSPLTSTLNYGVIGEDGKVQVRLIYDHRVLDGSTVARALARMEDILNSDILQELASEPRRQAA